MKVKELEWPTATTIAPGATLPDAARRMRTSDAAALAVVHDGFLIGIITERDIARGLRESRRPSSATVREWMTPGPSTVSVEDDVDDLLAMLGRGFGSVPVLEYGAVKGMAGMGDIPSVIRRGRGRRAPKRRDVRT